MDKEQKTMDKEQITMDKEQITMEKEQNNISLHDLRNNITSNNNDIVFQKTMFGGFKKKAVSDYINTLKESLQNAERSFNNRLEEYSASVTMLTQERDKYLKMLQEKERSNSECQENLQVLKQENENLNLKIIELSESIPDQDEIRIIEEALTQNEELKKTLQGLQNAEHSFNDRMDEYATSVTILTQERDKYLEMLHEKECSSSEVQKNLEVLKRENEELNIRIKELSENNQDEILIHEETLIKNEELKKTVQELEQKIKEFQEDNLALSQIPNDMELTINNLKEQLENCYKNENIKQEYEALFDENEFIKQLYDEVLSEKSMLLAEKNILFERKKRLEDSLAECNDTNKQIREENTKLKLKTRKMVAQLEAKIYECGQNHKQNIEQINDNIKNVLHIISYENIDITKLLKISQEDVDIEIDVGYEDNEVKEVIE